MNRVLIIDDEPWAREVVKSLGEWERLQLRVIGEAEDGREGLRLISILKPHIVITDMRMPGVDGVELLQQINSQFPSLKIIVMSGYDDFVYLKQSIRSRAVDYLLKPLDPSDLNEALLKCMKELEDQKQLVNTSWKSPLVFPSRNLMDRYLMLRQRVFGALFELNKPGVLQAYEKLAEFLDTVYPEGIDMAMSDKIKDDFVQLLQEFMTENQDTYIHSDPSPAVGAEGKNNPLRFLSLIYAEAIEKIEGLRKGKTRLVLSEVVSYIDRHYADPISLETIAQLIFVSKEHLSRAFKLTTGENITDYIIRKRMDKAKELLSIPDMSIKHAAQMAGYPELAYFHRVFKKHVGVTPGEYKSKALH
ncbi:response regulator [Cohnella sp.]|uniref:response regulator transcription factor n=1 Tax=Cohnella sp. TaxID=1883426 RepID=UPI003567457D